MGTGVGSGCGAGVGSGVGSAGGGAMLIARELLASLPSWLKLPEESEKELLATEIRALEVPLLAAVKTAE